MSCAGWEDCKKETLAQVFSREFSKISNNPFFIVQLRATSAFSFSEAPTGGVLGKRCSMKKGALEDFAKFTGNSHLACENFKNTFFTEHFWTTASGFFV